MEMTNEEYKEYAEKHAPRSPVWKNCLSAFLVGGLICCVGQFINQLYTMAGLDTQSAATADSITLVFLGVLLTALGLYDDIAKRAGAGTLVPITGFANSVAAPALEFKTDVSDIIRPSHKGPEFLGGYDDSIQKILYERSAGINSSADRLTAT